MKPLSREFLLARGYCCHLGCAACPYKEKSDKNCSSGVSNDKENLLWDTNTETYQVSNSGNLP